MKAGFFSPFFTSSTLIIIILLISITYKTLLNTKPNNLSTETSPFHNGNILNAQNLSLSKQLTHQIITTITQTIENESEDITDIDIWSLIFYSICCQSSLFRRKIWEKQLAYIPLSSALPPKYLNLIFDTLPNLNHINNTYKLFEYEYLYESSSAFFISNAIKSTQYDNFERIGPRRMKSMLKYSTLVINKGGLIFNDIHNIETALMNTFEYPVNTNVYFSGYRTTNDKISSRIHTDRQDTFIIQISGHKQWKIWKPKIKLAYFRQQRGKDDDEYYSPPNDLGIQWNDTLIDVILNPGDILYVPRAFPHQVEIKNGNVNEVSIHLTVGIETETTGLTMDNLLLCILGINKGNNEYIKQLTEIIMDITKHDKYEHFRRSIPFGFNYNSNDKDNKQIFNRVQNLTNEVYKLKQKFDKNVKRDRKRIKPSMELINKAYNIFNEGNKNLMYIYKNKLNIVEGKNWNEKQNDLQEILIREVKK
eukprot:500196_1